MKHVNWVKLKYEKFPIFYESLKLMNRRRRKLYAKGFKTVGRT
jgi:hypothetical protein